MHLEKRLEKDDPIIMEFMQRFLALESRLAVLETELKYLKGDVRLIKYMLLVYISATVVSMLLLRVVP
jgi:predicted RNA methylase